MLITPELKVALRQFFTQDSRERMVFLHGDINEETMVVSLCNMTVPPQVSSSGTVEIDDDYDPVKYFDYHDELKARHKEHPFIGQAHSHAGGAHHSSRDDNSDSLHGTDGEMFGDRIMFVSITTSGVRANNDFRCDIVVTPRGMPQYNIVHEDVEWKFLADSSAVEKMLEGTEERVSVAKTTTTKTGSGAPRSVGPKPTQGKKEKDDNYKRRLDSWKGRMAKWEKDNKETSGSKN